MIATDKNQTMKHVRKWAEGRNTFTEIMAIKIAGFAKECFQLFESVRNEKRIEGDIPLPSLKTWLKLYKNPKIIGKALRNSMSSSNEEDAKEANILKILEEGATQITNNPEKVKNELKKLTQDEWSEIRKNSMRMMEELKEITINELERSLNQKEHEEFKKNFTKPEFIFFCRVLAPCFGIYKIQPVELLKKAQSGDDKALDKLIRLDKSAIFEPKISEIIHEAQVLKAQAKMSMVKKAFTSPPNAMKMDAIKCQMGGLVSFITNLLKHKLNPSDIRKLYDAIAKDLKVDMLHDPDLHEMTVPAFAKRINRASSMWKSIVIQDKK